MTDWDRRFIHLAGHVATWSKDPSTKVGAVIVNPESMAVVATGYNGMPRGIVEIGEEGELNERWQRPEKYDWVVHAEVNAILNAARLGHPTDGCWMYLNWAPDPCSRCAGSIVNAGIAAVIGPDIAFTGKGNNTHYHTSIGATILSETGIWCRRITL